MFKGVSLLCLVLLLTGCVFGNKQANSTKTQLHLICPSKDGSHFVNESGDRFIAWGFNYDHDDSGRLIEDYWNKEWSTVEEDFREMKELGANVIRIHFQVGKFVKSPRKVNPEALAKLGHLLRLAEETGLYLDITGLGCYHKKDIPVWYDAMSEAERWDVQTLFWEAVAKVCANSPAIFCYDLMNEPILPGADKKETSWLAGAFGDKYFVQRLTLDLDGRTREQVARKWVDKLVAAIRIHDKRHMVTVGEIPWALSFPGAKPFFSSKEVGGRLDFTSVHFYPKKGEVAKALIALAVYDTGKPLVIEEMFPLACNVEELDTFIEGSRKMADGWIGFYWGKTIDEYSKVSGNWGAVFARAWLEYFRSKTSAIFKSGN
ncbi:MAG: cellulase family glycosylhydrolase [Kiritimatiellae bacterium]|nr:cellulase family glycosylhydrolase [Kiritimatiellia bacterium]MDD5522999.1 cellulase family glycosylhydrolase [Kiritimatiellia bacterium]